MVKQAVREEFEKKGTRNLYCDLGIAIIVPKP